MDTPLNEFCELHVFMWKGVQIFFTKRNSLIKHKEVVIVCEESGHINLSYNVLLSTPEVNIIVKRVVPMLQSNEH